MLTNEPLVWAWWGWEPLPFYLHYKRNAPGVKGCSDEQLISWYNYIHDEATVKKAAESGINCIVTHFVKGFGPAHEQRDMELTAKLVKTCHKYGITVFGYLQYGSIFFETFFEDIPEAKQWIQLDESGSPVKWCNQINRFMPCINARGFLDHLKSMIRKGLLETGLDALHFDNFYARPCYCPRCREEYRRLKGRELPSEHALTETPYDPEVIEWTRFRCDALTRRMKELRDYAKSIKPDVMLIWNPSPIRGLLDQRTLRAAGFYELGREAGYLWSESGNFPETSDGTPIHQVNFFKTYEAVGCRTFSTVWRSSTEGHGLPGSAQEIARLTAECAVFGAVPGSNWLMRPQYRSEFENSGPLYQEFCRQIRYYKDHAELFEGTAPGGRIALYFDRKAAESDFPSFYGKFLVIQQLLLQKHFTFDIVFSGDEEKLANYSSVITAGGRTPDHPHTLCLGSRLADGGIEGAYSAKITLPPDAEQLSAEISSLPGAREFTVEMPEHILIEKRIDKYGRTLLHLLNYGGADGTSEIKITLSREPDELEFFTPEKNIRMVRSGRQISICGLEIWGTLAVK